MCNDTPMTWQELATENTKLKERADQLVDHYCQLVYAVTNGKMSKMYTVSIVMAEVEQIITDTVQFANAALTEKVMRLEGAMTTAIGLLKTFELDILGESGDGQEETWPLMAEYLASFRAVLAGKEKEDE